MVADDRVVLLTGAARGIGLAIARALVQTDKRVVLTARPGSLDRLGALGFREGERCRITALDVTDTEQADAVVAEIERLWGGVDVLINNAAVCYRAVIEHLTDADEEDQFHTNYLGPLHLIRRCLPAMRAERRGHIINLSSVGGMMAMPTMGGYSASKFALEGASEALWYELRPWGIRVTLIEPGFVDSDSYAHALFAKRARASLEDPRDPYHAYYANLMAFIARMMGRSFSRPEHIARIVIRTMNSRNPPLRRPATLDAHLFTWLRQLLPKAIYHRILYAALPEIGSWVPPVDRDREGEPS